MQFFLFLLDGGKPQAQQLHIQRQLDNVKRILIGTISTPALLHPSPKPWELMWSHVWGFVYIQPQEQ